MLQAIRLLQGLNGDTFWYQGADIGRVKDSLGDDPILSDVTIHKYQRTLHIFKLWGNDPRDHEALLYGEYWRKHTGPFN